MDEEASSSATDVNPTFVYPICGTVFSVHHLANIGRAQGKNPSPSVHGSN